MATSHETSSAWSSSSSTGFSSVISSNNGAGGRMTPNLAIRVPDNEPFLQQGGLVSSNSDDDQYDTSAEGQEISPTRVMLVGADEGGAHGPARAQLSPDTAASATSSSIDSVTNSASSSTADTSQSEATSVSAADERLNVSSTASDSRRPFLSVASGPLAHLAAEAQHRRTTSQSSRGPFAFLGNLLSRSPRMTPNSSPRLDQPSTLRSPFAVDADAQGPPSTLRASAAELHRPAATSRSVRPLSAIGLALHNLTADLSITRYGFPLCGAILDDKYLLFGTTSGLYVLPLAQPEALNDAKTMSPGISKSRTTRKPIALVKRTRFSDLAVLSERSNVLLAMAGKNDSIRVYALEGLRMLIERQMVDQYGKKGYAIYSRSASNGKGKAKEVVQQPRPPPTVTGAASPPPSYYSISPASSIRNSARPAPLHSPVSGSTVRSIQTNVRPVASRRPSNASALRSPGTIRAQQSREFPAGSRRSSAATIVRRRRPSGTDIRSPRRDLHSTDDQERPPMPDRRGSLPLSSLSSLQTSTGAASSSSVTPQPSIARAQSMYLPKSATTPLLKRNERSPTQELASFLSESTAIRNSSAARQQAQPQPAPSGAAPRKTPRDPRTGSDASRHTSSSSLLGLQDFLRDGAPVSPMTRQRSASQLATGGPPPVVPTVTPKAQKRWSLNAVSSLLRPPPVVTSADSPPRRSLQEARPTLYEADEVQGQFRNPFATQTATPAASSGKAPIPSPPVPRESAWIEGAAAQHADAQAINPFDPLEYVKLAKTKGAKLMRAVETKKRSYLAVLCGEQGERIELFTVSDISLRAPDGHSSQRQGSKTISLSLNRTFILPESPKAIELQLQGDDLVDIYLVYAEAIFALEPSTVRVREIRIGRDRRTATPQSPRSDSNAAVANESPGSSQPNATEAVETAPPSTSPTRTMEEAMNARITAPQQSRAAYSMLRQLPFVPPVPSNVLSSSWTIPPTYNDVISLARSGRKSSGATLGPPSNDNLPLLSPVSLLGGQYSRSNGPPGLFFVSKGIEMTTIVTADGKAVVKRPFSWQIPDDSSLSTRKSEPAIESVDMLVSRHDKRTVLVAFSKRSVDAIAVDNPKYPSEADEPVNVVRTDSRPLTSLSLEHATMGRDVSFLATHHKSGQIVFAEKRSQHHSTIHTLVTLDP